MSHNALRLEFGLSDTRLTALVEELVTVLDAADDDGGILTSRTTPASAPVAPPADEQPQRPEAPATEASPPPADDPPEPPADGSQEAPVPSAADVGVAVLLCELVFTPPPEALERDARSATTSRVHAICDEVARRFDAHAQPGVGDGVAIFFGHPRPHGDEAQRAVRCGWELVRAIDAARGVLEREHDVTVRARIAIAAGTTGAGADDPFGDLPNVAADVQAAGDPGSVTIDAATFALVASPAAFQPAGERRRSPDGEPVALHRLVRPLGGAPGAAPARSTAPVFGRSGERALLRALADRARAGTRSAVMLRGEAGIGKTRIVEALRDVAAGELGMAVLECRCSPYQRGTPLHPILQGLDRHDTPGSPAAAPEHDTSLGRARREQLAALVSALAGHARRSPLLLVVEDLQWADPSTLELLGMLISGPPDLPLLLVLTARQDVAPLPGAALQMIDLPRLGDGGLRRVVAAAAAGGALSDAVVAELAERAGGSPLLAEELTRTMLATQDSEDRELIPATLYGCLMARLNRDGAARAVAQLAATIGREFDHDLLQALGTLDASELDWGLERLVADGVVGPGRDDGTYAFRHALLQDVARSSLRRGALRAHNLTIARTLLATFPDVAAAQAERVARHLEYAGELPESVGHWQRAARDARQRGAHREAAWHLERALMLTARMASTPERVTLELELRVPAARAHAAVAGHGDPVAVAHRRRAVALGTLAEHTRQSLHATLGLTRQQLFDGRVGDALALARLQSVAAKSSIEPALRLEAACELGSALLLAGQPMQAVEQLDRVLELYDPVRDREHASRFGRDPAAVALTQRALALACLDDRDGARAAAASAAQILRARRHPFSEAWMHCGAATAALVCGEREIVGREAAIGLEIATREGFAGWAAHASMLQGSTRVLEGDRQHGLEQLRAGVTAWDATGAGAMRPWHACLLAGGLLSCGEIDEGALAIEAGLAAIKGGERWCEPELHRLRAELLQAGGQADRATASAQQAIVCARRMLAPAWERRAAQTLAGLAGMPRAA